jgi:hypothetical protein
MFSKYQDKYTLWHDKEKGSNNWQNYTAMAKYLNLPYSPIDLMRYQSKCEFNKYIIYRHPNDPTPPISRDCIIGLYCLGLISYNRLKQNHFVYHGKGEPMNKKTFKKIIDGVLMLTMISIVYKKFHRNTFWKKKVKGIYQAAFRLPPSDVFWLKKCEGKPVHKEEKELWNLYVKYTLKKGTPGEKNLLWLQAKHMGDDKLARRCNPWFNFRSYFPIDHNFIGAIDVQDY